MANINRMTLLMSISEITPQIFISGQMAATLEQVQRLGITYILNVALESSPIVYPKHIKLEKYEIIDFPTAPISTYFNALTDKIHAHLTSNKSNKVLVHCMAGISRSTTIVCAYLMRYLNLPLRDAYLLCKKHRPICFPNLGFWTQLITYEYQLRKENSVKMVPTQYGQVPDVALEELRQIRQQQQQIPQATLSPVSLQFSSPTFSPVSNANSNALESNNFYSRPTGREINVNNPTGTIRSRSLAPNPVVRQSVVAASTNVSNPAYQTPIFATNKQTYLNPTRFDIRRLNPTAAAPPLVFQPPPAPASSSMSHSSNRSVPTKNKSKIETLPSGSQAAPLAARMSNPPSYAGSTSPRPPYETTYRASFIKPIVP